MTTFPNGPLGTSGDWRRRLLLHYGPLALASGVALVLFMALPTFDVSKYLPGDLFSGTFPRDYDDANAQAQHAAGQPPEQEGADHSERFGGQPPQQQGGGHQPPQEQDGGESVAQSGDEGARSRDFLSLNTRRFTVASGYVATGLLALTLVIGPTNLLLRRRRPISNYLARDVGAWAAAFSVVHVAYGLEVHSSITDPLPMFLSDGDPLTNSFGLANWTGLAATVIVVGLLALSSNFALRKLKARTWKNLQRLNYALFALVIAHAFFYGALLRLDSPFTLLLGVSVVAVLLGQGAGVWLWRRRYARARETPAVPAT